MNIEFKESLAVDTVKLDKLWLSIGWKTRGEEKWEEVLSKSSYMCSAWHGEELIGSGRIMEDGLMCMF